MDPRLLDTLRVIALPTKTNFRGVSVREVALFEGSYGWGEFSPFLEYDFQECVPWLACAIEAATKPLPPLGRSAIKINGTIPALNSHEDIARIVNSYPGVQTFKVKVGGNLSEDISRLKEVKSLRPEAKLRIDVNGSWSVETALSNLRAIFEGVGPLEYVEQPCNTVEELRALKEQLDLPILIAGDEVLRKAQDPFAVDLRGAVDILMLKVAPLGGITRSLQIAEHHQLPVVVSSALESAVGINYGLALASALPELNFDCGLGTGALLAADVAALPIHNGEIAVTTVTPSLHGLEVSAERYEWWKNRVMKTAQLLP